MTGTQQLEQPRDTREYVPRHAWAEPAEAPAVQASAAPSSDALLYEAPSIQPYQIVDTAGDYVAIAPERKRVWRSRKTA